MHAGRLPAKLRQLGNNSITLGILLCSRVPDGPEGVLGRRTPDAGRRTASKAVPNRRTGLIACLSGD